MITFHDPQLLWLLLALPLYLLLRGRHGGSPTIRFSNTRIAAEVARSTRRRWLGLLPLLRVVAAALLIVALARPQLGEAQSRVHASGIDILLAVDVSSSMDAMDMAHDGAVESRIDAVRDVVARFIEARPNDRIGLVAFAGAPYLVSPLTLDHDWLLANLDRLKTGLVEDGTAIGSALASGAERLDQEDATSKVMVLLTDGVNNAGAVQPSMAADAAAALGVKVYTIGVGVGGEVTVPMRGDDGAVRLVTTNADVDEATLTEIADTTGGRFFRATDADSLDSVYAEIDRLEATDRTIERFERFDERFAPPLFAGLLLLGGELAGAFALRRRIP